MTVSGVRSSWEIVDTKLLWSACTSLMPRLDSSSPLVPGRPRASSSGAVRPASPAAFLSRASSRRARSRSARSLNSVGDGPVFPACLPTGAPLLLEQAGQGLDHLAIGRAAGPAAQLVDRLLRPPLEPAGGQALERVH